MHYYVSLQQKTTVNQSPLSTTPTLLHKHLFKIIKNNGRGRIWHNLIEINNYFTKYLALTPHGLLGNDKPPPHHIPHHHHVILNLLQDLIKQALLYHICQARDDIRGDNNLVGPAIPTPPSHSHPPLSFPRRRESRLSYPPLRIGESRFGLRREVFKKVFVLLDSRLRGNDKTGAAGMTE